MPRDPECVFCKVISGELPGSVVMVDEFSIAFLDIEPLSEGHVLLIPKDHHPNLSDIPAQELGSLAAQIPRLGRALLDITGAEGFNVLCNQGRVSGQAVMHAHFHLIPRKSGDGLGFRWNPTSYPEGRAAELMREYQETLARHAK